MLYNEGKRVYLTEILKVKNFAGTGIRTHDLPTHWFFIIATPFLHGQLHLNVKSTSCQADENANNRIHCQYISQNKIQSYIPTLRFLVNFHVDILGIEPVTC